MMVSSSVELKVEGKCDLIGDQNYRQRKSGHVNSDRLGGLIQLKPIF